MKNENSQDKLTMFAESTNSKLDMLFFQAIWISLSANLAYFTVQSLPLFPDLDASLNGILILFKIGIVILEIILIIWIIRYFKLKKDTQMKSIKVKDEYGGEILFLLITPTVFAIDILLAYAKEKNKKLEKNVKVYVLT